MLWILPLFALLGAGRAQADGNAPPSPAAEEFPLMEEGDSRIRTLLYDEEEVYLIPTRYGYQSYIEFSREEEIETISIGDRSLWQIIPAGHRIFIRPMDENVITNMTVITNLRTYQFDIKAVSADPNKGGGIAYVVRFSYPRPYRKTPAGPFMMMTPPPAAPNAVYTPPYTPPYAPPAVATPASPPPAPPGGQTAGGGRSPGSYASRNYNYTYTGPDSEVPLQVFDDGQSTFFRLQDELTSPKLTVVRLDGSETPVEYYWREGYLVVDMVAPQFILKNPARKPVKIYNEMLPQEQS